MAEKVYGIIPPKDWLSRTDLLLRKRSEEMIEIDRAYTSYYNVRSEFNRRRLNDLLKQYVLSKGNGNWSGVSRNKASDGLMEYLYKATSEPRAKNVLELRVPEARHGVLYLWQNASVEAQTAKILLEGALDVASSDFSMLNSGSYQSGDKLGFLGVIDKNSKVANIGTGITVAKTLAGVVAGPKGAVKEFTVADVKDDPTAEEKVKKTFKEKASEVIATVKKFVLSALESTRLKWASGNMWGTVGNLVTALVNFILGKVASTAAPFVSSGINIAKGVAQAFAAAKEKASAWYQRNKFIITPGHPQLIGSAIETQMKWDIAKGLYNAAKGGATLASEIMSVGATALINLIASCVEFVYKVFTRLHQANAMNSWILQVKDVVKSRRTDPADQKARPSLCFDDKAFTQFFEQGCNASVCVPMMTLNSGISGDLMMFMKMFDDTGRLLGQNDNENFSNRAKEQFQAGDNYWTALKQKSRGYLGSTGFTFASTDKVASGLMTHALSHHEGVTSYLDRAVAFVAGG